MTTNQRGEGQFFKGQECPADHMALRKPFQGLSRKSRRSLHIRGVDVSASKAEIFTLQCVHRPPEALVKRSF